MFRHHPVLFWALLLAACLCSVQHVQAFTSTRMCRVSPVIPLRRKALGPPRPSHASIRNSPISYKSPTTILHTPPSPSSITLQSSSANSDVTPSSSSSSSSPTRATAVYALMLCNMVVFLLDKVFHYPFVSRQLYLFHRRWKWWQPLTTCFCHVDRAHLSNNLFLLLLFGRSVEDDQGLVGLLVSYIFCGVFASLVSILLLPKHTVSIGASGAVFGLFAVSTLAKVSSFSDLMDWRKLVEVAVLGEFVVRQITSELSTAAGGGTAGINHVAHLSGAAAGALLVFGLKATVTKLEGAEEKQQSKLQNKKKEGEQ